MEHDLLDRFLGSRLVMTWIANTAPTTIAATIRTSRHPGARAPLRSSASWGRRALRSVVRRPLVRLDPPFSHGPPRGGRRSAPPGTRPASAPPIVVRSPSLGRWNVTVASARTTGLLGSPVVRSTAVGVSSATTGTPDRRARRASDTAERTGSRSSCGAGPSSPSRGARRPRPMPSPRPARQSSGHPH